MKTLEILGPLIGDTPDELLRCDAFAFRFEHDRRAVRVVSADKMDFVALHALEAHPDIGLDVLHDVADVERAVRVRQGGSDEDSAFHRLGWLVKRSIVTNTSSIPCRCSG